MEESVFFFQAEDGIRDATVTGVQTCALPISRGASPRGVGGCGWRPGRDGGLALLRPRSEEGRGGEEGRSRGGPDPLKKKKKGERRLQWRKRSTLAEPCLPSSAET